MAVDVSKLQFYSGYPIDKITQSDTVSYTVNAGTPVSFGVPPNSLKTIANTYGQKCYVVASWSIDGTNFNSSQAQLSYYSATFLEPILKASVNVGCDASNIYLWLTNNFTSNLTFTINYAVFSTS